MQPQHNACTMRVQKPLNPPQKKKKKKEMVWWMRPPWRNSSHSRETNSTRWKFQIQYLFINTSPPSSIVRTSHTVSLWFSWNLNGVSRTFERWSKRSPLMPPSLVSPHYGPNKRGRNPPFFLFFPFSFFFFFFCVGGYAREENHHVCWRHF